MNEILKMLNALSAEELESVIMRASIILDKKKKDAADAAEREKERLRQEEIATLQRRLAELQRQSPAAPAPSNPQSGGYRPAGNAYAAAPQAQSVPVACPHCRYPNNPGTQYCANCGQSMNAHSPQAAPRPAPQPAPQPQAAPRPVPQPAPQPQAAPRPAPQPQAAPRPAPQPVPQASAAQVRYADEGMKKWEKLPNEYTVCIQHEALFYQPIKTGKYKFYVEITNKRILISRMSAAAAGAGVAFGLIGSLVRELADAGLKPYLEIPLTAITNFGIQNKKEYFIQADQTYVLKNKKYERILPEIISKAKA